jgi:hypothetical protein
VVQWLAGAAEKVLDLLAQIGLAPANWREQWEGTKASIANFFGGIGEKVSDFVEPARNAFDDLKAIWNGDVDSMSEGLIASVDATSKELKSTLSDSSQQGLGLGLDLTGGTDTVSGDTSGLNLSHDLESSALSERLREAEFQAEWAHSQALENLQAAHTEATRRAGNNKRAQRMADNAYEGARRAEELKWHNEQLAEMRTRAAEERALKIQQAAESATASSAIISATSAMTKASQDSAGTIEKSMRVVADAVNRMCTTVDTSGVAGKTIQKIGQTSFDASELTQKSFAGMCTAMGDFDDAGVNTTTTLREMERQTDLHMTAIVDNVRTKMAQAVRAVTAGYTAITRTAAEMLTLPGITGGGTVTSGTRAGASLVPFGGEVPHFASGGIVTRPTVAMIGEEEPEAIIPFSRLGRDNNAGGTTIQVNVLSGAVQVKSDDPDRLGQMVGDVIAQALENLSRSERRLTTGARRLLPGNP